MATSMSTTVERQTLIRLALDEDTLTHFEALASITGADVEQVITDHLRRTRNQTADRPIYFNDERAAELRSLLGAAVNTPEKAIDMIRRLLSFKVGTHKVTISPARKDAIYWWVRNSGMPEEQALAMLWDQALGLLLKC